MKPVGRRIVDTNVTWIAFVTPSVEVQRGARAANVRCIPYHGTGADRCRRLDDVRYRIEGAAALCAGCARQSKRAELKGDRLARHDGRDRLRPCVHTLKVVEGHQPSGTSRRYKTPRGSCPPRQRRGLNQAVGLSAGVTSQLTLNHAEFSTSRECGLRISRQMARLSNGAGRPAALVTLNSGSPPGRELQPPQRLAHSSSPGPGHANASTGSWLERRLDRLHGHRGVTATVRAPLEDRELVNGASDRDTDDVTGNFASAYSRANPEDFGCPEEIPFRKGWLTKRHCIVSQMNSRRGCRRVPELRCRRSDLEKHSSSKTIR